MKQLPTSLRQQQRRSRRQRGQAMLEYSIINWVLIVALLITSTTVKLDPEDGGPPENVIQMMFKAYQTYYDSFYFVLNMPFP